MNIRHVAKLSILRGDDVDEPPHNCERSGRCVPRTQIQHIVCILFDVSMRGILPERETKSIILRDQASPRGLSTTLVFPYLAEVIFLYCPDRELLLSMRESSTIIPVLDGLEDCRLTISFASIRQPTICILTFASFEMTSSFDR